MGSLTAELDRVTRAPNGSPRPARWAGVEHEFRVVDRDLQVDFRTLVPRLAVGRGGLDPGDACARRLVTGSMVTADGMEAEVATPPVALAPGFSVELVERAAGARADLDRELDGLRLDGYSTHLNIELPDRRVVRAGRRFVATCAPAMMLLMDRASSPGLLVRPRRGRLEICGEHLDGDALGVALVFAAAAATRVDSARSPRGLRVAGRAEPATGRFGWYIDRHAYGPDLYGAGRATWLGDRRAQDQLYRCWEWVRGTAVGLASPEEIDRVDAVVDGRRPLPLEGTPGDEGGTSAEPRSDAFGSVLHPRRRGELGITPRMVTWSFVILDVVGPTGSVHLGIPGRRLESVLAHLDAGRLDRVIGDLIADSASLPVLVSSDQTGELGAYRAVGNVRGLVSGERDPRSGRIGGPDGPWGRQSKNGSESAGEPGKADVPRARKLSTKALVAVGGVAVLVLGALAAAAVTGNDESDEVGGPTSVIATTPAPSVAGGPVETTIVAFSEIAVPDPCALLTPAEVASMADAMAAASGLPDHRATDMSPGSPVEGGDAVSAPGRACRWTFDQEGSQVIPLGPSNILLAAGALGRAADAECGSTDGEPLEGPWDRGQRTEWTFAFVVDGICIYLDYGGLWGQSDPLGEAVRPYLETIAERVEGA